MFKIIIMIIDNIYIYIIIYKVKRKINVKKNNLGIIIFFGWEFT